MPLPLLALAAIPSVVQAVSGLIGQGAGKRRAKNNPFPTETVNPLFAQNLAIAENMGKTGLPQQQYQQAQQGFARNQAGALRQFARTGGRGNLGGIIRAGNDSQLGLDAMDAQARIGNQRLAFGMRNQLANEQNRVWDWNNRSKFLQEAQAAGQQMGAGRSNLMGGLNNLSMLGSYAMYGQQGQPQNMGQLMGQSPITQNAIPKFGGVPQWQKQGLPWYLAQGQTQQLPPAYGLGAMTGFINK